MTRSVSGSSASVGLATFAEVQRLSTEGTLVDLSFLRPRERYTESLQLKGKSLDKIVSREGEVKPKMYL